MRSAYSSDMFPDGFWVSPLWKEAARAGLRQISKMVGQGNLVGASSLATTPGVLKPSLAGSQIKHLGRGNEGLATMVAHPEHGVAVRKLYDPRGITSPAMISRKEEIGRALGSNPNFAAFRGSAQTPHGQGTMHFSEFVPQAPGVAKTNDWTQHSLTTSQGARKALGELGYEGHDIRPGNMVQDARTGQNKLIDYIPARTGEMSSSPITPEKIEVNPAGHHLFNSEQRMGPATTGGLLGRMLGGKSHGSLGRTRPPGILGTMAVGTPPMTAPLRPQTPTVTTKPITPERAVQPATAPMRRGSISTSVL